MSQSVVNRVTDQYDPHKGFFLKTFLAIEVAQAAGQNGLANLLFSLVLSHYLKDDGCGTFLASNARFFVETSKAEFGDCGDEDGCDPNDLFVVQLGDREAVIPLRLLAWWVRRHLPELAQWRSKNRAQLVIQPVELAELVVQLKSKGYIPGYSERDKRDLHAEIRCNHHLALSDDDRLARKQAFAAVCAEPDSEEKETDSFFLRTVEAINVAQKAGQPALANLQFTWLLKEYLVLIGGSDRELDYTRARFYVEVSNEQEGFEELIGYRGYYGDALLVIELKGQQATMPLKMLPLGYRIDLPRYAELCRVQEPRQTVIESVALPELVRQLREADQIPTFEELEQLGAAQQMLYQCQCYLVVGVRDEPKTPVLLAIEDAIALICGGWRPRGYDSHGPWHRPAAIVSNVDERRLGDQEEVLS